MTLLQTMMDSLKPSPAGRLTAQKVCVAGGTGTGKTVWACALAVSYRDGTILPDGGHPRVWTLDVDGQCAWAASPGCRTWRLLPMLNQNGDDRGMPADILRTKPGDLLIVDEAHLYGAGDALAAFVQLLRRSRPWGVHVVYTTQRPQALPPDATSLATWHCLFRMSEARDRARFADRAPAQAIDRVCQDYNKRLFVLARGA